MVGNPTYAVIPVERTPSKVRMKARNKHNSTFQRVSVVTVKCMHATHANYQRQSQRRRVWQMDVIVWVYTYAYMHICKEKGKEKEIAKRHCGRTKTKIAACATNARMMRTHANFHYCAYAYDRASPLCLCCRHDLYCQEYGRNHL